MKTFNIVKKHVDRLDRMGLLDMGAPKDEYDIESRLIGERITADSTADEIAEVMADVFSRMFSLENESAEKYYPAAKGIYDALQGLRSETL